MAVRRLALYLWILAGFVCSFDHARAAGVLCAAHPGFTELKGVRVSIGRQPGKEPQRPLLVTISGAAGLFGTNPHEVTAHSLCVAALGRTTLNDEGICANFIRPIRTGDTVDFHEGHIDFALSDKIPATSNVRIAGFDPQRTCSTQFTIQYRAAPDENVDVIPFPDKFRNGGIEYTQIGPMHDASILINVMGYELPAPVELRKPIPSWWNAPNPQTRDYIASSFMVITLLFFIAAFWRISMLAGISQSRMFDAGRALFIAAFSLQLASILSERWPSYEGILPKSAGEELHAALVGLTSTWSDFLAKTLVSVVASCAIGLAIVLGVGLILRGAAWLLARGRTWEWPAKAFGNVLLWAVFLNLPVLALIAATTPLSGDASSIGYEVPALLVSGVVGLFVLFPLRNVFLRDKPFIAALSILAAATLLYPYIALSDNQIVGYNTHFWFADITRQLTRPVLLTAYLLTALGIAGANADAREADVRALLGLFLLGGIQIAPLNLIDIVVVVAALVCADRFLIARSDGKPVPDFVLGRSAIERAVFAGITAATIAWLQHMRAPAESGPSPTLLAAASYLTSYFASAAVGMLLLEKGFTTLRGESATIKAVLLSSALVAVSIGSDFSRLFDLKSVAPAIANVIAVVGAILAVSIAAYDLPNLGRQFEKMWSGGDGRQEFFKQLVPILSAVAVAVATSLVPQIFQRISPDSGKTMQTSHAADSFKTDQTGAKLPDNGGR